MASNGQNVDFSSARSLAELNDRLARLNQEQQEAALLAINEAKARADELTIPFTVAYEMRIKVWIRLDWVTKTLIGFLLMITGFSLPKCSVFGSAYADIVSLLHFILVLLQSINNFKKFTRNPPAEPVYVRTPEVSTMQDAVMRKYFVWNNKGVKYNVYQEADDEILAEHPYGGRIVSEYTLALAFREYQLQLKAQKKLDGPVIEVQKIHLKEWEDEMRKKQNDRLPEIIANIQAAYNEAYVLNTTSQRQYKEDLSRWYIDRENACSNKFLRNKIILGAMLLLFLIGFGASVICPSSSPVGNFVSMPAILIEIRILCFMYGVINKKETFQTGHEVVTVQTTVNRAGQVQQGTTRNILQAV
jgi:hypothetical protein